MKKFLLILILTSSCTGGSDTDLSDLPVVNSVSEIQNNEGASIPFTGGSFWVSGIVKSNFYFLGKGVVELQDINKPESTLLVATEKKHTVGSKITISINKQEIVSMNDEAIDLFIEQ